MGTKTILQFVSMKVLVTNKQKSLPILARSARDAAKAIIAFEGSVYDEVGIHFVTPKKICQLHQTFFNDPSITDCISFPVDLFSFDLGETSKNLGDVFICPQVALDYAIKNNKDPYEETTLYLIHGLLHLMGYDDMEKEKRLLMRAAEKRHMQHLKKNRLLLSI